LLQEWTQRSHPLSIFNELKRRKVFRVAIGYVIAAWLVVQVADLVADNFLAPVWVMQMIITLLFVGLPISLILSWAFDLTADGIKRTGNGEIEGNLPVSNKFVLALVGGFGLFVAVAVIFYVAWPRDDRSIAVLPFEDISPGGDQAYFGNGIADELRLELQASAKRVTVFESPFSSLMWRMDSQSGRNPIIASWRIYSRCRRRSQRRWPGPWE